MRYLKAMVVALAALLVAGVVPAARAAEPAGGTVEKITVHGKSLEGNLSGDPADRTVYVYLPPSYAQQKQQRYPVVYFLHGYSATADNYVQMLGWPAAINRALAAGKLPEMIFVLPNAMNP